MPYANNKGVGQPAVAQAHWFQGKLKFPLTYNGKSDNYTPGIYAEGHIVFVLPFVIPSRSWNYFKVLR